MIIIADSGSTKTHWAIGTRRETRWVWRFATTPGLNPRLTSEEDMRRALTAVREQAEGASGDGERLSVKFYGAGCGTAEMQETVRKRVCEVLGDADVEVAGDMLGACRAVCGEKSGIVGILGTGSNACLYDGREIVKQVTSTGYVLGDEGSGNHIGRRLLKDFMVGKMPEELAKEMREEYGLTVNGILQAIYHEPYANRYMASFAPFAARHRGTQYVRELLGEVFGAFWKEMIVPLSPNGGEVGLVGSVAEAFEIEIAKAAPEEFRVESVEGNPIEGLIRNIR